MNESEIKAYVKQKIEKAIVGVEQESTKFDFKSKVSIL